MKRTLRVFGAGCLILWLALSANAAAAEPRSPEAKELIQAKAGELLLTLRRTTDGIGVVGLRDLTLNE